MALEKTTWKPAPLVALMMLIILLAGCHEDAGTNDATDDSDGDGGFDGEVWIGGIMVFSGGAGPLGESAKQGMELAAAEINAAGGVNGKELKLDFGDTKLEPSEATRVFQDKIAGGRIQAVVGALASGITAALIAPSKEGEVVLMSPASTLAELTRPRQSDYFFRIIPSDIIQGTQAASLVFNDLEMSETVVMYQNNAYASGLKDVFVEEYEKLTGTVDGAPIAFDASDVAGYPSQAQEAVQAAPGHIWIAGQYPEIGHMIKELRDAGYDGPIMTSEAIEDSRIFEIATSELDGVLFTKPAIDTDASTYSDFGTAFQARFGAGPGAYSAYGYDALHVLAEAMEKGGESGPQIRAAVQDTTFTGRVSNPTVDFNQNGDVSAGDYVLWQIDGEAFVLYDA
ncbi:MAG: ABC transporter substrate-binding protein [Euryarchaeota archaeon]|nr:ABC transporter substrate-binding protein [Euryarchaeota archaeon]